MVSFRELYGYLTAEKRGGRSAHQGGAGTRRCRARTPRPSCSAERGRRDPDPATAAPPRRSPRPTPRRRPPAVGLAGRAGTGATDRGGDAGRAVYAQQEIDARRRAQRRGDPARTGGDAEGRHRPSRGGGASGGLALKAIDWQKASGIVGQFVTMIRVVLYMAVLIIFVVALVIINNALVMATLERVQEIGTLRAVGAQRRFVLWHAAGRDPGGGDDVRRPGGAAGRRRRAGLRLGRGIPAANDSSTSSSPARAAPGLGRRQPGRGRSPS